MRTLFVIALLVTLLSVVSAFSLLREFDDESLLPHLNRIPRGATASSEESDVVGSGQEKVEGSGERVTRDVELKEASGEETKEKVRKRREDDLIAGSGQEEEGSGEETKKPVSVRRRRTAEADEFESSGHEVEGSGQA